MSQALTELLHLLKLEQIEKTIFRGQSQDLGFPQVFGGQVIGQSLSAAKQTVDEDRSLHSYHCYFLRPGDASKPIVYEVDYARDGRSFTSRRIVAIQNGKTILHASASFQVPEEGLEHQHPDMPDVPGPEELVTQQEQMMKFAHKVKDPIKREKLLAPKPIEIRPVENDYAKATVAPPIKHYWIKSAGVMPDDLRIHKYVLAYTSDFGLLGSALKPHGLSLPNTQLKLASIDHAIWFHHDFRMDDWLLYAMESPTASGARGMTRGQIFDRSGRLVASTAQEGLMRTR